MQGFYKLTLRPILEKIEVSILTNLLTASERNRIEVEFDFDSLLRADSKSRFDSYRIGITAGVMTPNEARAAEHLSAKPGGDDLLIQGAMMPITLLGKQPATPAVPPTDPNTDNPQDDQPNAN
jgi:phage portal protein BeeE